MTNKTAIKQIEELLESAERNFEIYTMVVKNGVDYPPLVLPPSLQAARDSINKAHSLAAEEAKYNTQKLNYALLSALDSRIKELKEAQKPTVEAGFVDGYKPCKCGASSAYINIHKVVCCGNCGGPLEIFPYPAENKGNTSGLWKAIKDWWDFRPLRTSRGETIPYSSYKNVDEWSIAFSEILAKFREPK